MNQFHFGLKNKCESYKNIKIIEYRKLQINAYTGIDDDDFNTIPPFQKQQQKIKNKEDSLSLSELFSNLFLNPRTFSLENHKYVRLFSK